MFEIFKFFCEEFPFFNELLLDFLYSSFCLFSLSLFSLSILHPSWGLFVNNVKVVVFPLQTFLLVPSPSASSSTTDLEEQSEMLSSDLLFLIISKYSLNLYPSLN